MCAGAPRGKDESRVVLGLRNGRPCLMAMVGNMRDEGESMLVFKKIAAWRRQRTGSQVSDRRVDRVSAP
jgi:hypothetical protein